jgi:hypothetical protein
VETKLPVELNPDIDLVGDSILLSLSEYLFRGDLASGKISDCTDDADDDGLRERFDVGSTLGGMMNLEAAAALAWTGGDQHHRWRCSPFQKSLPLSLPALCLQDSARSVVDKIAGTRPSSSVHMISETLMGQRQGRRAYLS